MSDYAKLMEMHAHDATAQDMLQNRKIDAIAKRVEDIAADVAKLKVDVAAHGKSVFDDLAKVKEVITSLKPKAFTGWGSLLK